MALDPGFQRGPGDVAAPSRTPFWVRLKYMVDDFADEVNWSRVCHQCLAYAYLLLVLWLAYCISPWSGHWKTAPVSDRVPVSHHNLDNYFNDFHGAAECKIRAADLYPPMAPPPSHDRARDSYCPTRKALLAAMSGGGRVGFDAPYSSRGCRYRWYTIDEICMILERFDALVFVGDASLQAVYNGLNILLRQDLVAGPLKTWDMDQDTAKRCRCDGVFTMQTCAGYFITACDDVTLHTGATGSRFVCSRVPHAFLRVDSSPAPQDVREKFQALAPTVPRSNYKPVPIVHGLSPNAVSPATAADSLMEFLQLADDAGRKTPMLWIGPTAAGHVEIKDRKGNQEIWDFDKHMAAVAEQNDIEVLKMWNLTVQAGSWDGVRFGERVAITQAMMVINWLSRLESS